MQGQYQHELKQLLEKLHLNSIEQLLQLEVISAEKISGRCKVHSIVVEQYLQRIHQIALKTQLLERKQMLSPIPQPLLNLQSMYPGYSPQLSLSLQESQLLEVLGRANSGKTYFLINCIKQALLKDIQPILLSSSAVCTREYVEAIGRDNLMVFQFEGIGELGMLVHAIGNQILEGVYGQNCTPESKSRKYLVVIDSLSQIQSQETPTEFDSSQKFRRLMSIFMSRTQTSIIYSYRVNNSLFPTQYKRQHHRPKCKNSKEWDGWANKNVIVDFVVRKKDGRLVSRLGVCKGLDCRIGQAVFAST